MVRCKFCGRTVPNEEFFPHLHADHPEEMQEIRRQPKRRSCQRRQHLCQKKLALAFPRTSSLNPVQAAIMEFTGEKLQLPMTPALIYGYFCAKKMGFDGNVGGFLTEVIDDFFQARGINYYEVTMRGGYS